MLKSFIKYHSLGNDFIIFDWYKKPEMFIERELASSTWSDFVRFIADRHTGIGADGILVVKMDRQKVGYQMIVYNTDGTKAEMCLNGLRSVAHYLFTQHQVSNNFTITTENREIACTIQGSKDKPAEIEISMAVGIVELGGIQSITIDQQEIQGFVASIGNPHFVVMQRQTPEWLSRHGKEIEHHRAFPNKTNVEFVWHDGTAYHLLIHERGCGMTKACSSGAAAVLGVLRAQNEIELGKPINLIMPGGAIQGQVGPDGGIKLIGRASHVFKGTL
jgi:diaminopimelate epimerase